MIAFFVAEGVSRWQRRGLLVRGSRALVDPPREHVDLRWRELLLARRHLAGRDALVEQAVGMIARFDRRTGIAAMEESPRQPGVERSLQLVSFAVAMPAVGLEDRPHMGLELDHIGSVVGGPELGRKLHQDHEQRHSPHGGFHRRVRQTDQNAKHPGGAAL